MCGYVSTDLRCFANSRTHESSAAVESTSDSVARNWICPMSTTAIVVDGARDLADVCMKEVACCA